MRAAVQTVMLALVLTIACDAAGPGVPVVRGGRPAAVIVLPADPDEGETKAAEELGRYVRRISGAELVVCRPGAPQQGLTHILIGRAAPVSVDGAIRAKGSDAASFALIADGTTIAIRGLSPEGTLFGVYELLEQLGVRWFMPGELGTVVPRARDLSLSRQTTVQVPSFGSRWHSGSRKAPWLREWQTRVRMGGPRFPSSHGIDLGPEGSFQAHPEYYSLVNGVRTRRQLCISNPEVIRLAALQLKNGWNGMGPNDSQGFCECPNCRALDPGDFDPFLGAQSMTDRYIWFFNRVLDAASSLRRDLTPRPNEEKLRIGFYAYDACMRPPVREKPHAGITPAIAPINLCRIHGAGNPICPEKRYLLTLIREWRKLCPEVYDRGYWFNLADIGLPFSMVHRMRQEIPAEKKLGIRGFRVETSAGSECHWATETPSLYIAARLMWDCNADVDALLMDFYAKFFGPAAKPMQSYFETMDAAFRDADYHTGCMFDMPNIYTHSVRKKALGHLNEARRLAGSGDCGKRVEIFRLGFDYLQEFVFTADRANSMDFVAAAKGVQRVEAIMRKLQAYDPPMLARGGGFPEKFLESFYGRMVRSGLERTTASGELVASLADEWQFFQDTGNVGLDIGLQEPGSGGNWRNIKAYTQSWGNHGYRYYRGPAWYRQAVTIPPKFADRKITLWVGNAYLRDIRAWINGRELTRSESSGAPFEFDATSAAIAGEVAVVVIRVTNDRLRELGIGGITGPVMLYSPSIN